MFKTKLL